MAKKNTHTAVPSKPVEYYAFERSNERKIFDFRPLNLDPIRLLGCYHYAKTKGNLRTHCHGEMIEISYLESGRQTFDVKDESFPLVGGDIFLTFPGEHHGTGTHPVSRGVMYWMLISADDAQPPFLNLPRNESQQILHHLLQAPQRHFRGRSTISPVLRSIFKTHADTGNPLRTADLRNLLLRFVLEVIGSAYEPKPSTYYSAEVRAAMSYVKTHIEEPLPLADLARYTGLSLSRLKSKFKEEAGVPPGDYITRCRIERAAQLLHETDDTITDIAMKLGFSSSQYFATVFKRYTLQSPQSTRALKHHPSL